MRSRPDREPAALPRKGVRAVDRALELLCAFSATHPRLQLSELAEAAALPKPSAHRIATSLVAQGFLRQEPDGAYVLGTRLLELGSLVSYSSALTHLTLGVVDELSRSTGETVLVAEVDWDDRTVVITHKRDATHPLSVSSPVGLRSPVGNGCIGKAVVAGLPPDQAAGLVSRLKLTRRTARSITDPDRFLAEVSAARLRGYATESGEFLVGVAGAAAPVIVNDHPIGAVALIAPASRCPRRRLEELGWRIRSLLATARLSRPADGLPRAHPEV